MLWCSFINQKVGPMKKLTLKQAQQDPKAMSQFIAEHDGLEVDGERFEAVMGSMSGKPKEAQEASSGDISADCT